MKNEIVNQIWEAHRVPGGIKPKEEHTETQNKQTDKN